MSVAAANHPIRCEGTYPHHLQGVCTDSSDPGSSGSIFWSFTTTLLRTDTRGKVLKSVDVADHHGDLCYHNGRVWVAVNLGEFNQPAGKADSWLYVYDANTLECLQKIRLPEVVHGAGGIAFGNNRFLVVGGLPESESVNYVYEYDGDFRFVGRHQLQSGHTHLGIQTAAFSDNHWWFGCYGSPKILLKVSGDLQQVQKYEFDCSLGIIAAPGNRFWVARGALIPGQGYTGELAEAIADPQSGLREKS